jgi:hypothetical protein
MTSGVKKLSVERWLKRQTSDAEKRALGPDLLETVPEALHLRATH